MASAVFVQTSNDTYGNPRRGYLITEGDQTYFEPEGFEGMQGVLRHRGQHLRDALNASVVVNVGVREFNRLVKWYR